MPRFWNTPAFAALNEEWTKRLAADGFVDHEPVEGGLLRGGNGTPRGMRARHEGMCPATCLAREIALWRIDHPDFRSRFKARDRHIIELRVGPREGEPKTTREVAELLKVSRKKITRLMKELKAWNPSA